MKVLFMPNSLITLLWRLVTGLSGRSLYDKISPIAEKQGQSIFSKNMTVVDDSLNDSYPGARAFDDEGMACAPLTLIDKGMLKSFYFDLKYAKKLGAAPTGHGYRTGPWGEDPITVKPGPALGELLAEIREKQLQDELTTPAQARRWARARLGKADAPRRVRRTRR